MRILAIDIGNTTIAVGLIEEGACVALTRISSRETLAVVAQTFPKAMAELLQGRDAPEGAVISSVVPHLLPEIAAAVEKELGNQALVLTSDTPLPVRNGYARPREAGLDRLANAVGGVELAGAPVIIVDAGTAVTLDVVNAQGVFIGGAILPGAELWSAALSFHTAALPTVNLEAPERVIGTTTVENILSGIVYGLSGAIDRLVEVTRKELGSPAPVLLTGGGAPLLAPYLECTRHVTPHLTLVGLAAIRKHSNPS